MESFNEKCADCGANAELTVDDVPFCFACDAKQLGVIGCAVPLNYFDNLLPPKRKEENESEYIQEMADRFGVGGRY